MTHPFVETESKITIIDKMMSATILHLIPSFITPNHITAFRFGSLPFVIYFLSTGQFKLGLVAFVIAALSDAIDGAMARTRDQVTEWGKMYDPVADKMLIGTVAAIAVSKFLGKELAFAIILLEVVIMVYAFYRRRFLGADISAKKVGKIKMVLQSLGVGFLLLYMAWPVPILLPISAYILYASILFALLSLFVYRSI
ncbi:MAG: hypothetical protein COV70_01350 [Parcubacteria group bacterium CG11_big_fil_rev_8_21_14_0_20_39_22]|nr:MAG: hypothetical protein COV70_01350 [Parcubacteria group bacterium CG11_big_fil_rev_8_21_14_0_20_39_22]